MIVPNFKILVPEKSLTKKSEHKHTEKVKTIDPLYTSYTGGIIKLKDLPYSMLAPFCSLQFPLLA